MHALAKFRQYLVGNRFKVKVDHSLRFFLEQKELNERQQKWVSKIQAYNVEIEYVKGKTNIVVDALSRRPTSLSVMEIAADWKAHLLVEYSKNKFACEILDVLSLEFCSFGYGGSTILVDDQIGRSAKFGGGAISFGPRSSGMILTILSARRASQCQSPSPARDRSAHSAEPLIPLMATCLDLELGPRASGVLFCFTN